MVSYGFVLILKLKKKPLKPPLNYQFSTEQLTERVKHERVNTVEYLVAKDTDIYIKKSVKTKKEQRVNLWLSFISTLLQLISAAPKWLKNSRCSFKTPTIKILERLRLSKAGKG